MQSEVGSRCVYGCKGPDNFWGFEFGEFEKLGIGIHNKDFGLEPIVQSLTKLEGVLWQSFEVQCEIGFN